MDKTSRLTGRRMLFTATMALCAFAGLAPPAQAARHSARAHPAADDPIWQRQANQAARFAERFGRTIGLSVWVIPVGAGGKNDTARARLAAALAQFAQGRAAKSPAVTRMIQGAQEATRPTSEDEAPGGTAESIYFGAGRSACVIRLRTAGPSLPEALDTAFASQAVRELALVARRGGLSAEDVALWVSAHEAAHCLIGGARRANLLDTAWSQSQKAPRAWADAQSASDGDNAVAARTEEVAADLVAAAWVKKALPARKAKALVRVVRLGRHLGSVYTQDDLHDSSRALNRAAARSVRPASRGMLAAAWKLAKADTLQALGAAGKEHRD